MQEARYRLMETVSGAVYVRNGEEWREITFSIHVRDGVVDDFKFSAYRPGEHEADWEYSSEAESIDGLAAAIEVMLLDELAAALRIGVVARFDHTQTHEYVADTRVIQRITGSSPKTARIMSEEELERELEVDRFYEA